ncbi:cullin-3 [Colletotrichum orchidophilum]|uniref:Cullin-3 n=1 Tax=Colletotrichum orchidophilum TaxID=1209926 RepID=A0A1G4BS17_9PEZI|nr:cullin-3 [Colletotrichum orchidophilum]OHF04178.1 cullin-3 [Colletotrichum orchidophilum]
MSNRQSRGRTDQGDVGKGKSQRRQSPDSEYSTQWDAIACVLAQVHDRKTVEESFESTYRRIYKVVLIRREDKLFTDTIKWHEERLQVIWSKQKGRLIGAGGLDSGSQVRFLQGFLDVWMSYWEAISVLPDLLSYLERVTKRSLLNECMNIFLASITASGSSSGSVIDSIAFLTYSHVYVRPLQSDDPTIRVHDLAGSCYRVIDGLCEVGGKDSRPKFIDLIEKNYLERLRGYYQTSAEVLASQTSVVDFCSTIRRWLLEEECRCHVILPRHMDEDLQKLVVAVALEPHLDRIIRRDTQSVFKLLDDGTTGDLGIVYQTTKLAMEGPKILLKVMEEWLSAATGVLLGSSATAESKLLDLIRLDIKVYNLHGQALISDPDMEKIIITILVSQIKGSLSSSEGIEAWRNFEAGKLGSANEPVIVDRIRFYGSMIMREPEGEREN